jgi:uncharacterized protein
MKNSYIKDTLWKSMAGTTIHDIESALQQKITENESQGFIQTLCIGTDSQVHTRKGEDIITVVTAIVILRQGKGGNVFYHTSSISQSMTIRERMLYESTQSIIIAHELHNIIHKENLNLQIHADINTNSAHKSNVALKEAMEQVMSMDITFKAKPDAWASSYVANKFTK